MNSNPATLQKLEALRLHGMVRAFRATFETGITHQFSPDELLSHLVDAEWDERQNRRLDRLLAAARFRSPASLEQLDWGLPRNLDKNQLLRLADCRWIERHQNLLVSGPTGAGKSFIASALGHQACLYGHRTGYWPCGKLFKQLKLSRADGTYLKELARLQRLDLLLIDDLGLEPFDGPSRLSLLEILEDRVGRRSTLIVSQIPVSGWHELIGDATIADAICDRIVHSAHRIELQGESVRKIYAHREEKQA